MYSMRLYCWFNANVVKAHSYVRYSFILNDPIEELIKEICSRHPLHNVCLVRHVPSVMGRGVGDATAL